MPLTYSDAVGYKGLAMVSGKRLLATGGSVAVNQDVLSSSGVWGATPSTAAAIAWAYNYMRLEGSISYEMTDTCWKSISDFALAKRDSGAKVVVSPDSKKGFSGTGYCASASFNCSEGAIMAGDINFQADAGADFEEFPPGGSIADEIAGADHLIPYWATKTTLNKDTISWQCSYNADIQLLKCCTGDVSAPAGADYLLLGDMSGDCSITIFTLAKGFKPSSYQKTESGVVITCGTATGGQAGTITFPLLVANSVQSSIQQGASYLTMDISYTAYGNGKSAPVSF